MPGQGVLAKEFEVSGKTVYRALRLLMAEGLLASEGRGRGALITAKSSLRVSGKVSKRVLRVAVLSMVPIDEMFPGHHLDLTRLVRDLENDGHAATLVGFPAGKGRGKSGGLPKLFRATPADVWLVHLGSFEVLDWLRRTDVPVLALGGVIGNLPIPSFSFDLTECLARAVDRLMTMGHGRIVLITPGFWRRPKPGAIVTAFARAMESQGVRATEFNLPDWTETREGLARLLDSLFRVTPPTALICVAPHTTSGVLGWLLAHGLSVPKDVSLVAFGMDPSEGWCVPGLDVASMDSDTALFWRRVREWVAELAKGRIRSESVSFEIKLIEGNSMGPPPVDRG
jgi:hypothetical protein